MKSKDYYYILGLKRNASILEIKEAFRKLSLKFHPDKNSGDDGDFWANRFIDIKEAYEILSNENRRKEYDSRFDSSKEDVVNLDYENEFAIKIEKSVRLYNEKKVLYEKYYSDLKRVYPKPQKMTIAKWISCFLVLILVMYFIKPLYEDTINAKSDPINSVEFLTSDTEVYVYVEPNIKSPKMGLFKDYGDIEFVGETTYFYKISIENGSFGFVRKKDLRYDKKLSALKHEEINYDEEIFKNPVSYNVIVYKAYFYEKPDFSTMRKSYLVENEKITATKASNNFVYTEFINASNKKTVGWIELKNLEEIKIESKSDVNLSIEEYFYPFILPDKSVSYCYKNDCNSIVCSIKQRKVFYELILKETNVYIEQSFSYDEIQRKEILISLIKYKVSDNSIVEFESNVPALKLVGENPNKLNYSKVVLKTPGNIWVTTQGRETTTYKSYWGNYNGEKCIVVEERVKFENPSNDEKEIEKIVAKSFYMKNIGLVYYTTYLNDVQRKTLCIEFIEN